MHTASLALLLVACSADPSGGDPYRPPSRPVDPADPGNPGIPDPSYSGDAGPGMSLPPPGDPACETIAIDARPDPVNVMIVQDRSGSMRTDGVNRWRPSVESIRAVTAALGDRLQFGLSLFPSPGAAQCAPGEVMVMPGPDTTERIMATLDRQTVDGGTPTARTLRRIKAPLLELPGRTYVLLVTDGAPNCNPEMTASCDVCTAPPGYPDCSVQPLNCLDDEDAVAAVTSLATARIPTFVIGYELAAEFGPVLDRMAAAGGTGRDAHIPVRDRTTLEAALREIGGSVVSCEYALAEPPGDVRYVRVTIDGETIPHRDSPMAGEATWRLEGDRTVVLEGAACARLRDGLPHRLEITRECEPVLF